MADIFFTHLMDDDVTSSLNNKYSIHCSRSHPHLAYDSVLSCTLYLLYASSLSLCKSSNAIKLVDIEGNSISPEARILRNVSTGTRCTSIISSASLLPGAESSWHAQTGCQSGISNVMRSSLPVLVTMENISSVRQRRVSVQVGYDSPHLGIHTEKWCKAISTPLDLCDARMMIRQQRMPFPAFQASLRNICTPCDCALRLFNLSFHLAISNKLANVACLNRICNEGLKVYIHNAQ